MSQRIRIGSRESRLAVAQAEIVKNMITDVYPETEVSIITMKTTGDRILDRSLDQVGGKGLFVKELDQALRKGEIDLSVHSLKDMPMEIPEDLPVLAFTKREDPRDVLLYRSGTALLPENGLIGTSSKRRMIQLQKLYPSCRFQGIRGNVQTRMKKLETEGLDATVLAAAGLARLHMSDLPGRYFSTEEVIPAAGQGILAVQGRAGEYEELCAVLNDENAEIMAQAERAFVKQLDGGCSSPVAAYAQVTGEKVLLRGLYYRESDERYFVEECCENRESAQEAGERLAKNMKKKYGES